MLLAPIECEHVISPLCPLLVHIYIWRPLHIVSRISVILITLHVELLRRCCAEYTGHFYSSRYCRSLIYQRSFKGAGIFMHKDLFPDHLSSQFRCVLLAFDFTLLSQAGKLPKLPFHISFPLQVFESHLSRLQYPNIICFSNYTLAKSTRRSHSVTSWGFHHPSFHHFTLLNRHIFHLQTVLLTFNTCDQLLNYIGRAKSNTE